MLAAGTIVMMTNTLYDLINIFTPPHYRTVAVPKEIFYKRLHVLFSCISLKRVVI